VNLEKIQNGPSAFAFMQKFYKLINKSFTKKIILAYSQTSLCSTVWDKRHFMHHTQTHKSVPIPNPKAQASGLLLDITYDCRFIWMLSVLFTKRMWDITHRESKNIYRQQRLKSLARCSNQFSRCRLEPHICTNDRVFIPIHCFLSQLLDTHRRRRSTGLSMLQRSHRFHAVSCARR